MTLKLALAVAVAVLSRAVVVLWRTLSAEREKVEDAIAVAERSAEACEAMAEALERLRSESRNAPRE